MENTAVLKEHFHGAVGDAIERRGLDVSPFSRVYVVEVLSTFARPEQLFRKYRYGFVEGEGLEPLGLKYFSALQEKSSSVRFAQLKDLGDQCLFLAGYFYDLLRKHGLDYVEYHYTLGSSAYASLSQRLGQKEPAIGDLFSELAHRFRDFCIVIGDLHLPALNDDQKLLAMYERWRETLDERYASLLVAKGCILVQKEGKMVH